MLKEIGNDDESALLIIDMQAGEVEGHPREMVPRLVQEILTLRGYFYSISRPVVHVGKIRKFDAPIIGTMREVNKQCKLNRLQGLRDNGSGQFLLQIKDNDTVLLKRAPSAWSAVLEAFFKKENIKTAVLVGLQENVPPYARSGACLTDTAIDLRAEGFNVIIATEGTNYVKLIPAKGEERLPHDARWSERELLRRIELNAALGIKICPIDEIIARPTVSAEQPILYRVNAL